MGDSEKGWVGITFHAGRQQILSSDRLKTGAPENKVGAVAQQRIGVVTEGSDEGYTRW